MVGCGFFSRKNSKNGPIRINLIFLIFSKNV
jgi:hypothetical protein